MNIPHPLLLLFIFQSSLHLSTCYKHPFSPGQRCETFPTPTALAPPHPLPDGLLYLLSTAEQIESFFSDHFESKPLHIPSSTRPDLAQWNLFYRSILPTENHINQILQYNSSVTSAKGLQLTTDLDFYRLQQSKQNTWHHARLSTFIPGTNRVEISHIRSALDDGFELVVHHMEARSKVVNTLVESIQTFFAVNVTADLRKLPKNTRQITNASVGSVSCKERLFIVLGGVLQLTIFPEIFPLPTSIHLNDEQVLETIQKNINKSDTPLTIDLSEGDVIYIPRGYASDIRTTSTHGVLLEMSIHTEDIDLQRGLLAALRISTQTMSSNVMEEDVQGGKGLLWDDVMKIAIQMSAELMPQLRKHLPIGTAVGDTMETATGEGSVSMIEESLKQFAKAAKQALFEPMIHALAEEEMQDKRVTQWARWVNEKEERLQNAKRRFKQCVDQFTKGETVAYDVVTQITLEVYDMWKEGREKRQSWVQKGLQAHGQSEVKEMDMDEDEVCDVEREAVGACSL